MNNDLLAPEKEKTGMARNFISIGSGQIPDGYFGDWRTVAFFWDPRSGKTIVLSNVGYFTYQTPCSQSKEEAYWLLENHPSSNARFVIAS